MELAHANGILSDWLQIMVERRDRVLAEAGGRRGRYSLSGPFPRFH